MKEITIPPMHNTMAPTIISPMDVFFYQTGVMRNYFNRQEIAPYFDVKVVTTSGSKRISTKISQKVPESV